MMLRNICHFSAKTVISLLSFVFLFESCATVSSAWLTDRETSYPPSKYISALGSGGTVQEAQQNALGEIAYFFSTSVKTSHELVNTYKETKINDFYESVEHRQIQEKSQIDSEAQLFCVQFSTPAKKGGLFHTVAYIDRESAYKTYIDNIKVNTIILRSLIVLAEKHDFPFECVAASKKGVAVANMTAQMLKNVHALKMGNEDFSETENLIDRMFQAHKKNLSSVTLSLSVENDWNGTVFRTLSELLENEGFAITKNGENVALVAQIEPNRSENAAGVFLTCGLKIRAVDSAERVVFSYTRSFERIGAPAQYEEVAWRKSFSSIATELRTSFLKEFNNRLNGD
ncbi:LPP20 family lipoprotein [Treponema zioleckii]|uniref:LPP20 family lipoprotein n=1 Tax=Treponema zioleckii TaxID=331680 RepID=UPI00168B605B|nr:LPP20 family lipoprotein [Treponema zioleckii]